ncbi:MAG: N-acetyl-gamma-glutamyl-phosphate reductase [Spartobacteria bacterium]|nr:N-acetyl-gamma-glutamyl-phosphate reductase [Spartobacteria bacterium]
MKKRAKIVGASGYGGIGIIELLLKHPEVDISCLVSVQDVGQPISKLYPHLSGFCDQVIVAVDDPQAREPFDVVFFSTPDRVGMEQAPAELAKGAKVIDYSGDFRFNKTETYADYATRLGKEPSHLAADLLPESVYGLGELHRKQIADQNTRLIGNPGCFAISCILGLSPAVKNSIIDLSSIICDCKTAISGAGKKASPTFHYPARYDNMNAYRLTGHQHVCEIEHQLSVQAGEPVMVTFTAQVVPMCRGIMSCLYGTLKEGINEADVLALYRDFYKDSPFVRVLEQDSGVGTVHVRGTNYCNLIVSVDARTRRLRVVSHIDNLVKGQAGNALQNMNLLFGYAETAGLESPGQYP